MGNSGGSRTRPMTETGGPILHPQFVKIGRSAGTVWNRSRTGTSAQQRLIELVNTKIRVITRMAFGFHSVSPLIAQAVLTLGGHLDVRPSWGRDVGRGLSGMARLGVV